jgi:hypothetical protein
MKDSQTNSSGASGLIERVRYLFDLFRMRWIGRGTFDNQEKLDLVEEYVAIAAKHGIDLRQAQILEIGVGQRPYLGITLYGLGYDYRGVDLDVTFYPPSIQKIRRLHHSNGALRLLKTLVRYYLFDRSEYQKLFTSLGVKSSQIERSKIFVQANAAYVDYNNIFADASGAVNSCPLVVVSESVFEHIPLADLGLILHNLNSFALASRRKLLLLTRPTIYTGICGSHLTEWYHHAVYSDTPKRSQPWEHLRLNRYVADTYLNQLSLAQFRDLFTSCGYYIAEESVKHPCLGAAFLRDPQIRQELSAWPDEELLSNDVMFECLPII